MAKYTQGAKANVNGTSVEDMCLFPFLQRDFCYYENKREYEQAEMEGLPDRYVRRNAPYTSIYGSKGRTEFLVVDGERKVRIEIKTQNSKGSVDEKLPYLYLNAIEAYPEDEIVIVIDGEGFKKGAIEWLRKKVKDNWLNVKKKKIHVFSISSYSGWVNDNF